MTNANKVKVSKEVAEAIEMYLDECTDVLKRPLEDAKTVLVAEHYGQDWRKYEVGQYVALNDITTNNLMTAMVVGYEIEKTPEERVVAYYEQLREEYEHEAMAAVVSTLNLLELKIEGVNA